MKPVSLSTITIKDTLTPEQRFRALGPIAERHGRLERGADLPATNVGACPRVKVADLPTGFLKTNHIDALEQNQKISSCCRHPENHEVEARKSHPGEAAPDIYIFHCTCGRRHNFFCVGREDVRPAWGAA